VFYKARIDSRKPRTKIKRCWNCTCTLKRAGSSSYQCLYAWSTLGSTLKRTVTVLHSNFRVLPIFHPKSPILISQHPNMFPKLVYRYMNSKGLSKTYQTWNQMLFQHNTPIQLIFTKPSTTTTQFIPQIWNYEHSRYESSTTIHSSSFMGKTQVYMYIHHKHVKIQH